MKRINIWLDKAAVKITEVVGSMWCAIIFSLIALTSLPDVIILSAEDNTMAPIIQWIAQTFLQLVLLSIILKGQNLASEKHEQIVGQIKENTARTEAAAERIEFIVKIINRKEEKQLKEIKKKTRGTEGNG